jgi:hypothetical protein
MPTQSTTSSRPGGYGKAAIQAAIEAQLSRQPRVKDPLRELRQYFEDGLVAFKDLPNDGDIVLWWGVSNISLPTSFILYLIEAHRRMPINTPLLLSWRVIYWPFKLPPSLLNGSSHSAA